MTGPAQPSAEPSSSQTDFTDTVKQVGVPVATKSGRHPSRPTSAGGYEILGEIGRGAMGVVYRAYDAELKRHVALKMLWTGIEASPHDLSCFRGEAEIVASLIHPNIVQIYDIGIHDGHPYLALELVEGGSLDQKTARKPQSARFAATTIQVLARAIHLAHEQGIIHRDLKPANILLTADGTLKITDFGLAKRLSDSSGATKTGDVKGTPSYMAPEQADGRVREFGPATDVYALGTILYELLTGRPPFLGADMFETLEQVRGAEPTSPSRLVPRLPRDLCTICLKCLEKSPARRYPTALELADDLQRWQNGESIHARPVGRSERFVRLVKRHPLATGMVVACAVALVAVVLYGLAASERAHELRLRKEMEAEFDRSLTALDDISNLVMTHDRISRLSGLEPLHDKLLDYYQDLIERRSRLTSSRSKTLAGACMRLGSLMSKTGNKAGAAEAFQQARELFATSLPDTTENNEQLQLAVCLLELGKLSRDLGRLDDSERHYNDARLALDHLRSTKSSPAIRQHLAEVWHNNGILLDATKRKTEALTAYEESRRLRDDLVNEDRENVSFVRDLARSYGYIGDTQLDLGFREKAMASYTESHRLREGIAQSRPSDPEARFQLARSHGNFGNYHTRHRDFAAAIKSVEQARELQQTLVESEPAVAEYRIDLVRSLSRLAELKRLADPQTSMNDCEIVLQRAIGMFPRTTLGSGSDALVRSCIAEALVLQAIVRLDQDAAAVAEPLQASELLLTDLCRQRGDALDWYYMAIVRAIRVETNDNTTPAADECAAAFQQAISRGYRRKHPQDVRNERAFRSLAKHQAFQNLLMDYEHAWNRNHAP